MVDNEPPAEDSSPAAITTTPAVSAASTASTASMLRSADEKYELLNIVENKRAVAQIMLDMKIQNFEKINNKKINNVSSTGRDISGRTNPHMICTFVDQVDNGRVLENTCKPTGTLGKYKPVDSNKITEPPEMKCTDATADSMYAVQNSTESKNIMSSNYKKRTYDSMMSIPAHVAEQVDKSNCTDLDMDSNSSASPSGTFSSVEDEAMIGFF